MPFIVILISIMLFKHSIAYNNNLTHHGRNLPNRNHIMNFENNAELYLNNKIKIKNELNHNILINQNPYELPNIDTYVDNGYIGTHLSKRLAIEIYILQSKFQGFPVNLYLEAGCMLGGSLILAHNAIKNMNTLGNNSITPPLFIALDPFLGDAHMWLWERRDENRKNWKHLRLKHGQPTIYERFLANIIKANIQDDVIPFRTTSIVGFRTLIRMYNKRSITTNSRAD